MALDNTFTFLDETTVHLLPIPPLTIDYVVSTEAGRPQVPMVVVARKGHRVHEANPDDPEFQAAVTKWQQAKEKRVLRLLIDRGVQENPPDEVVDEYRRYLPEGSDDADIKYLWIADKLPDSEEVTRFVEAVTSQTSPTEEGIAESEAAFPGDSEQQTHQRVPVATPNGSDQAVVNV